MTKHHGQNALNGLEAYCNLEHHHKDGDRFGRMFPHAAPLLNDPRVLEALGAPGGPMDGGANPAKTSSVAIGHVFFGQFVDHDITLDIASSFTSVNDPAEISNARTPTLDLDCIYGPGPEAAPYLYHADGDFRGVKLVTGKEVGTGAHTNDDLARVGKVALIGDHRNDENRIVSQVQLAMIRCHNRFCQELYDEAQADGRELKGAELFEEARQMMSWHYQWCVIHDFLKTMCGAGVVNRILGEGRKYYTPKTPFIPVEFSVAAYRFGHSMAPMKLQVQKGQNSFELFGTTLGRGFSPVPGPKAVVDMLEMFEVDPTRNVERASKLDTKLASDLLALPMPEIIPEGERSLATRNMTRGQSFLLPSGETIARHMGRPEEEIARVRDKALLANPDLTTGIPLWFYLLQEAELIGREDGDGSCQPGEGLGPVGATIVAEVIIGLIQLDSRSWLSNNLNWRPKDNLETVGQMVTYV